MTDILQVSDQDVVLELNGLQELGLPLIGAGYGASEATVMSFANRAESIVLSTIPEMYRAMTREVRGEIVVEMAFDGQTTFLLGLSPVVEDSVALYVDFGRSGSDYPGAGAGTVPAVNRVTSQALSNYGSPGRTPYTFRDIYDRLPEENFSVDTDTGDVALINDYTLRGGSKVYADYKHKGMSKCHNLRDIAIRIAAANFGGSLSGISDSARDYLTQMMRDAKQQLYATMNGEAGIDLLDNLKLVDETRQPYRIPRRGFSVFM